MTWFSRFNRLLYIAYLNCEYSLKEFAFFICGMVLAIFLLIIVSPQVEIPYDYGIFTVQYNTMAMYNWGIALIWVTQVVFSLIFSGSFLQVAYIYDNRSWGYVHSAKSLKPMLKDVIDRFNAQLDKDEADHDSLVQKHLEMIEEEIKKVRA